MEIISIPLAIVTVLIGVAVGIISAMFGLGGGIIMVPLLRLLYNLPAPMASATSLATTIPTTFSSLANRWKDGEVHLRTGLITGIAGACVSPVGSFAATNLPGVFAMTITAILIAYTAVNMFRRARKAQAAELEEPSDLEKELPEEELGPQAIAERENREASPTAKGADSFSHRWVTPVAIGAIAGFISGLSGVAGILIIPIYVSILRYTMKEASATSLVAVAILSIPGLTTHLMLGNVRIVFSLLLILGAVPGSRIGSILVRRSSNVRLSYLFSAVLLLAAVALIIREVM